jgi:hypothetical protein
MHYGKSEYIYKPLYALIAAEKMAKNQEVGVKGEITKEELIKRVSLRIARVFRNIHMIKPNFIEIELPYNSYIYVDAESYYYRVVVDQEVARIYFRDSDFERLVSMLKDKWITETGLRPILNSIATDIIKIIKASYRPTQ